MGQISNQQQTAIAMTELHQRQKTKLRIIIKQQQQQQQQHHSTTNSDATQTATCRKKNIKAISCGLTSSF